MGLLDQFAGLFGRELSQIGPQVAPQLLQAAMSDSRFAGVGGLLQHLSDAGLGQQVASWTNPDAKNQPVDANQVSQALGGNQLANIAASLGVTPQAAAEFLAQHLPGAAAAHAEGELPPDPEPH